MRNLLKLSVTAPAALLVVLAGSAVWAQEGQEQQGPTPVSTVVRPGVITVVPAETVVAPVQAPVEARTEDAGQGLAEEGSSSNLFTGVRGGLIGAAIGFGAVVALAVVASVLRMAFRRPRT